MRSKVSLWLGVFLLAATPALAQNGKVHGHVQDPAGSPLANMQIRLSSDGGRTTKYTFTTDQNGDYKGDNVVPGPYVATLVQPPDKQVDRDTNVNITAANDTLKDFDLSRPDYIATLPPEEQKQIADIKAKNAQANKENQSVAKLNDMLKEARQDDTDKKYDEAATLMQQAVAIKGDTPILWLELGVAQIGQKKYSDAQVSLQKVLDLDQASKKPNPEMEAAANNNLGETNAALNKIPEATADYDAAAKLMPANAATYYTNEAIVLGKTGDTDATVAAADKAIAADPTKPVPYFLKGQALVGKASVDPKTHAVVAPPGCVEAYEKYLELAPDGPLAAETKQILAGIGVTVNNSYKAGKK
jgi:tetratricopeptide (TPR) repeat protein